MTEVLAQHRGCYHGTSILLNPCVVWRRGCTGVRLRRSSSFIRPVQRRGFPLAAQASIAERVTAVKGKFKVPEHWQEHVKNMAGGKQRALHRYFDMVKDINELEPQMQKLTDDDLKAKTAEFRQRLNNGVPLDELLVEAFAVVREVSSRVLRLRHFDAQLVGGIVLHEGSIAEMKTGEGKTLVATLPTYLNALTGKGVHVVTVNDYLAERDAGWMGKIFKFLDLSVAVVTDATLHPSRQALFKADVLYITAMQLTFTYLHDNTTKTEQAVAIRRPFNYAIVDEVDSILIDDCRNPMLISGSSANPVDRYRVATQVIAGLTEDTTESGTEESGPNKNGAAQESTEDSDTEQGDDTDQDERPKPASGSTQFRPKQEGDFVLDVKSRQAALTEMGLRKVHATLRASPAVSERFKQSEDPVMVWEEEEPWGPYIINAIKAEHLYIRDTDYIVEDELHVKIISRSTGRVQSKSRWTDNMHQAVEAKENLKIGLDGSTQATITYQMFFRYYAKLAGMTGTAITEAEEFYNVYNLNVVQVPSRLPNQRIDHDPVLFVDNQLKLLNVYVIAMRAHRQHRPVLIGTSSVEESEAIQQVLEGTKWPKQSGIYPWELWLKLDWMKELRRHAAKLARTSMMLLYDGHVKPESLALLNAKPENVRREAQTIAQAGLPGAVTIATNMAGRGTDIVLGGNPKGLALQVLMKIFARYFLTGKEYASNKESLDQMSLPAFSWVVPAPDVLDDEPDTPVYGPQAPAAAQSPQANSNGHTANGLEGAGNRQQPPAHGLGVHLKDPSADGPRSSSNGQPKPTEGSAPPSNGKHQPSNGASANGSAPPLNGQHGRLSTNGAPNNGHHAARDGSAIPGSDANRPSSHEPQATAESPGRRTQGQPQGLVDLEAVLKKENLPKELATRLLKTAQVCSVSQSRMSLDAAQSMISAVLDQAEELQTQIITNAWGGVSAFAAESHAYEATLKADELFNNDQVPAFQKDPAAGSPESARRETGGKGKNPSAVGLEVQKHLAWSAMHLLFYLELTCREMAKDVKAVKGLLVISTAIQDSKRSVNQLQGRAGRQGDPGETLTFYDFNDVVLQGDATAASAGSVVLNGLVEYGLDPWLEGVVVNKMLQSVTGSLEGMYRGQREDLHKFDQVMEQFRQHIYSLRRMILCGAHDQSIEMLQFYFQDAANLLVESIINARKPVGKWKWDQLLKQINHLAYHPPLPSDMDPSGKEITLYTDEASFSPAPPPPDSASSSPPAAASSPTSGPSSSQSSDTQTASDAAGGIRLSHHRSSHSSAEASTSSPATTSPATTSPATSGPATTSPATSGPATSGPAASSPATSGPATNGPATSGPAISNSPQAAAPPLPRLTPEQKKQVQSGIPEYDWGRSSASAAGPTGQAAHKAAGQSRAASGPPEPAPGVFASSGPESEPEVINEFTVGMDRLKKEDLAKICDALEVDGSLDVPVPEHLDPGYKERINRHRGALEHSAKGSGGQPRIKGRFGRQAERLRSWLGEYLIAKYEQTVQEDRVKAVRRPKEWERDLMLDTLDEIWAHFLRETSSLHSGVSLRAWSHMDPVEEFKLEAGAAFLQALADFRHECVSDALEGPQSAYIIRSLQNARVAFNKQGATDATTASATMPPLALNGSTDIIDVQGHASDSESSQKQPQTDGMSAPKAKS